MEFKLTYPKRKKHNKFWRIFTKIYNILFVTSIFVLPLINWWVGGKWWSVVALFGAFTIWSSLISPSLYEINRTYLSIKNSLYVLILLILVDFFLTSGGWGLLVIPIVSFGALIVCTSLFFSDFNRQKHNAVPFVLITLLSISAGLFGIFSPLITVKWMFVVLAGLGFSIFVTSMVLLRKSVFEDLVKQFNTK